MKKTIQKLIQSYAVSGYEWELDIAKNIQNLVGFKGKRIGDNLVYEFGQGKKTVFFSAHMDEVGFFITRIEKDYVQIVPIGDVSIKDTIGTRLAFLVNGKIFTSDKVKQTGSFSSLKISGLLHAAVGDIGTFQKQIKFDNEIIQAPSLDNKVGCVTLLKLLKTVSNKKLNINVVICFSCREEVGTNGLINVVRQYNPDICIDIDSAYARPIPTDEKNWCIPTIGKGPAVQLQGKNFIIRSSNRRLVESICRENSLPYQYEIPASDAGGTNNSSIANLGFDFLQINIPVAYQHSAKSKTSLKDIEYTVTLLTKLLDKLNSSMI